MEAVIRDARHDDMKQVLELIQELADFENEPNEVEVTSADLEQYGFGSTPSFKCFVADVANDIIGIALVYFRFSTWKGSVVHLEDLIVSKKHRGTGVGSALYKKVMEYASEQGAKRVSWEVLGWNKPAINFYEKSGAKILDDWHVVQMDQKGLAAFLEKE